MNKEDIQNKAEDFIAWGHGVWGDNFHFATKSGTKYKKSEYDLLYLEIASMLIERVRGNKFAEKENPYNDFIK